MCVAGRWQNPNVSFLSKPFQASVLVDRVRELLADAGSRARRERQRLKPEGDGRPTDSRRRLSKSEQPCRTDAAGIGAGVDPSVRCRLKAVPKRRLRILIVDDEESVRRFVERVLSEAGYDTATASDGAEALEMAEKFGAVRRAGDRRDDAADDGRRAGAALRQKEPRLKVLYLTGFSDRLFKEKVTLWADEAFLDKPCSVKGLLQAVSLLVSGRLDQRSPSAIRTHARLPAPRVHLEMRILLEGSHRNERSAIAERQPILGAAIGARLAMPCAMSSANCRRRRAAAQRRRASRGRAQRTGTGTTAHRRSVGCDRRSCRTARSSTR